ncbi:MAG: hypothetical protein JKP98_03220 [Rhodobacteraceae bacterium]|nr:hypothetical protein [Paracoccaceae bacterium]
MVPRLSLSRLIADVRPTVVLCDVEGGELDLFAGADLAGVRAVILELHPRVYGEEGTAQVLHALRQAGLSRVVPPRRSSVQLFLRDPEAGMQPALPRTPRGRGDSGRDRAGQPAPASWSPPACATRARMCWNGWPGTRQSA